MRDHSSVNRRNFLQSMAVAGAAGPLAGVALSESASAQEEQQQRRGRGSVFRSRWEHMPDRYWTGPDTWANPWEDWQIQSGELVCTRGGGKSRRTLHCLTHQLGDNAEFAFLGTTIRARETDGPRTGDAGMMIGVQVNDPIDDYRSRLLFGSGTLALVGMDGTLQFGKKQEVFPLVAEKMQSGETIRLACLLQPSEDGATYTVTLVAGNPDDREEIYGKLEVADVPADSLKGNVALTAQFAVSQEDEEKDNGLFSFERWVLGGQKFEANQEQALGPVLWTMYTLSRNTMKLTAQMPILGEHDVDVCGLEVQKNGAWTQIATVPIERLSRTATFKVADWNDAVDTPYRVTWTQKYTDGQTENYTFDGVVRKDPKEESQLTVAGYCCFTDFLFPNADVARQTADADPDILMFTGDQIYEGVGGWGIIREGDADRMFTNYLRKLALLGWSFRDVMRDRPTVWMPDDHDVYHGNVWGAGGRKIELAEWSSKSGYDGSSTVGTLGGYVQPAEFVNAVQRTQCNHLPDPYDPTPIDQGITVYYTDLVYGRVSFAILEDRKFKSGPMAVFKHKSHRPDWVVDPKSALEADVPEAKMLGDRQLSFLKTWGEDWLGVDVKMAISQTIFANAATHHGGPTHFLVADMDSNGWPQSGRARALKELRRAYAFMLAGDQHLPTIIQHGIEKAGDAGWSFCVPAGATGYQRWWRPEEIEHMVPLTERRDDLPNTGLYRDGFGNLLDFKAVANPPVKRTSTSKVELGVQKASGFGLVHVNKESGDIRMDAWPVGADVSDDTAQFPGWPLTTTVDAQAGENNPALPPIVMKREIEGGLQPVVQVIDADGEIVSMARMTGDNFRARVFDVSGRYTVHVLVPEQSDSPIATFEGVSVRDSRMLTVE